METFPFAKYSGCGNDFIVIDNRTHFFPHDKPFIQKLCHRKEGIGADGIVLLDTSNHADFGMQIYNTDGSEAEMCGNGLRCLYHFLSKIDLQKPKLTFATKWAIWKVEKKGEEIAINMNPPKDIFTKGDFHYINTGVPHVVLFSPNNQSLQESPLSFEKVNVNVATITPKKEISLRTWERGVNAETLACGTGAVATALTASLVCNLPSPITIIPKSEEPLTVTFKKNGADFSNIILTGPATYVYSGHFSSGN